MSVETVTVTARGAAPGGAAPGGAGAGEDPAVERTAGSSPAETAPGIAGHPAQGAPSLAEFRAGSGRALAEFPAGAALAEFPAGAALGPAESVGPAEPPAGAAARPRAARPRAARWRALFASRAVRTHFGTVAGVAILAVLMWRLGTGVFLDGLRRIDATTLLAALGIGLATTVLSAWRWALVARGLRIRLPFGAAVADYYRALFLNAALPGGVLGDVHRAVRHGRSEGDLGRGVRTVVLERAAGQAALAVVGVAVLLTMPSPVLGEARHFAPLAVLAAAGALAVVVALRMNGTSSRRGRVLRATLAEAREAREALLSRRNGPGVVVSSVLVLAGHVAMFVLSARVAGAGASVAVLLPLAVLALLAMGLPLNVGGFGPREGVTAWAFGAAGIGASSGLAVAVVYGVLSFVASLPGAVVLVVRWYEGLRAASTAAAGGEDYADPSREVGEVSEVSREKYAPKDSVRLASNSRPFSAEPSEGRPMTPESV